jgi:hypothetical protein
MTEAPLLERDGVLAGLSEHLASASDGRGRLVLPRWWNWR